MARALKTPNRTNPWPLLMAERHLPFRLHLTLHCRYAAYFASTNRCTQTQTLELTGQKCLSSSIS